MAHASPQLSVVIRSYQRLPAMLDLVRACLAQDHPSFEVLVIEQSGEARAPHRAALDALACDPRVQFFETPPLGPLGARREGIRRARGEILLFMDDDDLPVGTSWISAHATNFEDPLCVAAAGRQIFSLDEDPARFNNYWNYSRCLSYSFLKMPRAHVRHTRRKQGVESLPGGNVSVRRALIERLHGWEENDVPPFHEENSFDFRFRRNKHAGEYFVYDPSAVMLRRFDVHGGLDRRAADAGRVVYEELAYSHGVVKKYFPVRFYALYPAYVYLGFTRSLAFMRRFHPDEPWLAHATEIGRGFLPALRRVWSR